MASKKTDTETIDRPEGAEEVPRLADLPESVPMPPEPPPPNDSPDFANLSEAQKRAVLGLEPTELEIERQKLQHDEQEHFAFAVAYSRIEEDYPEEEQEFRRKTLHGQLLIAEAAVERRRARVEALESQQ